MSKVCVFAAQGLEECECLVPVDILRRAGIEVTIAAVGGKQAVTGSHGITFMADALAEQVDLSSFDMIFLPGGMPGTNNLKENALVCEAVQRFDYEGKFVAAICAAPTVLGYCGVLKGRRACCYPGCEGGLTGADVRTDAEAVRDEHIITGRGMGAATAFGLKLVEALQDGAAARKLGDAIVWMHELA